jgi:hypothetical protein
LKSFVTWAGKEAAVTLGLAAVTGGTSAEAQAAVKLFRAVGISEADDIAAKGIFRIVGNSMEGKGFWRNADDAVKFAETELGKKMYPNGYRIAEGTFSAETVARMYHYAGSLDGIGPAVFASPEHLVGAAARLIP